MLSFNSENSSGPTRVVIMGAGSFIGKSLARQLAACGIRTLGLGRPDIDLTANDAAEKLTAALQPDDALVVISARAPVKDAGMLKENIVMMEAVCRAIKQVPPQHVSYVSSDAVYADSDGPLTESSVTAPESLHGVMHLARELMLKDVAGDRLAILRPTLVYGMEDPHNGYGPNRFLRLALAGQDIVLFGEGEERRDHVYVEDVGRAIAKTVIRKGIGALNIASGTVTSFHDIAALVRELTQKQITIQGSKRSGPMPHNGYRPFDISALKTAFPEALPTSLADGLTATLARL